MKYAKRALVSLAAGVFLMGSDCPAINDPVLSVNVQELYLTVNLNGGTTLSVSDSTTLTSDDYLGGDFANLENVRIYDITLQTTGDYAGTTTGNGMINGTQLVSWTGVSWNSLHTAVSLLGGSSPLTLNGAGVTALQNAVQSAASIKLKGTASASASPAPVGSITLRVYAQVDASPN